MSFKIAYNSNTETFFTDVSFIMACNAIADNLKVARAAVKAGEFEDIAGAMSAMSLDIETHFHHDLSENISNLELLDPYAMVLACLVGGSLDDVISGSFVSYFWLDGAGQNILNCRSGNGIAKKINA